MYLVNNVIRQIIAWISQLVVWCIELVYGLLIQVADVSVFSDAVISKVGQRISVILGVIMLLKVVFSLVTYAINPDAIEDKTKGAGKLITNFVVVLVLLTTINFVFEQAYKLQNIILKNNIIPKIIFGNTIKNQDEAYGNETITNAGSEISFYIFSPFLEFNQEVVGNVCVGIYAPNGTKVKVGGNTMSLEELNKKCVDAVSTAVGNTTITNKIINSALGHNISPLFDSDTINIRSNDQYLFNYQALLSIACGIIALLIITGFAIDISIRAVKISFLQLIAPIPIISYIDPKSSGMFKKWTTECTKTYVDVFIRLLALFFAIFVISGVANGSMKLNSTNEPIAWPTMGYIQVAIIIGALLFAKQLPSLIENLTGAKLSGSFNLNPLKKLKETPLIGGAIDSGARFAGRTAGALAGYAGNKLGAGAKKIGEGIDNATGNRISGVTNKTKAWMRDKSDRFNARAPELASTLSGIKSDAQSTMYGITGGLINGSRAADKMEKSIKEYDSVAGNIDALMKRANSEMIKHEDLEFDDNAGNHVNMRDFKLAKENLNALRSRNTSGMSQGELQTHIGQINDLQTAISKTEKLAEQAYIDAVKSGNINGTPLQDVEVSSRLSNIEQTIRSSSDEVVRSIDVSTGAGLKDGKDKVSEQKIKVQMSEEYQKAEEKKRAMPKRDKK